MRRSMVSRGTIIRVRSCSGLSASVEPSKTRLRSSDTTHAPSFMRLPVTPSVNTPCHPGRYGFAQPLHVIWAEAAGGMSQATPLTATAQMVRLNNTNSDPLIF